MVLEPVECPVCHGTNVIKHGKSGEGKQRYLCQDQECCGKTFIRDYSDLGRLPQISPVPYEKPYQAASCRGFLTPIRSLNNVRIVSNARRKAPLVSSLSGTRLNS